MRKSLVLFVVAVALVGSAVARADSVAIISSGSAASSPVGYASVTVVVDAVIDGASCAQGQVYAGPLNLELYLSGPGDPGVTTTYVSNATTTDGECTYEGDFAFDVDGANVVDATTGEIDLRMYDPSTSDGTNVLWTIDVPSLVLAPAAPTQPAPATTTAPDPNVTALETEVATLHAELAQLQAEYQDLNARVARIEAASLPAEDAYTAAVAQGESPQMAATNAEAQALNFVYQLGEFAPTS